MAGPLLIAAIGAGAGLLKSELIDRPKENRQRRLAAETQRYSPWTGLKADKIEEADPLGSAMTFGAAGAGLGQNLQTAEAQNKLMAAQTDVLGKESQWLGAGRSPYANQYQPRYTFQGPSALKQQGPMTYQSSQNFWDQPNPWAVK